VNPSEAALDLETETLKQVKRLGLDVEIRLVFVTVDWELRLDRELADGEYVEIDAYLGRHKVYRPVAEEPDSTRDDDVPF
jgi:hypothetical protein